MPIKAVQQFMLGTVLSNEQQAKETLAAMKAAGYDGIELCGFMIHPIGFVVKLLTKAAGMPVGMGGNLDWHKLVQEAFRWSACTQTLALWSGMLTQWPRKPRASAHSMWSSPGCTGLITAMKPLYTSLRSG